MTKYICLSITTYSNFFKFSFFNLSYSFSLSGLKKEKEKVEKQIEGILGDIKEKGIILRNIENGLSDFPSVKEGEDIFYCWTAEETQIEYWHYRYEGYNGRKPI